MKIIARQVTHQISHALGRGKSVLLLGARQTGKTTLCTQFEVDLSLSLVNPRLRHRYEQSPELLLGEVEALAEDKKKKPIIWIDEVQKVPHLFDTLQELIDTQKAQFLLTGSSARKLRAHVDSNWLPGRLVICYLDPLMQSELKDSPYHPSLESILQQGTLPGIITTENSEDKEIDLKAYVYSYLEEEIRAEALTRQIGSFSKFLTLAAAESGQIVNFSKLSQEIGVAHTTIAGYYRILEDCLIATSVEPLSISKTRRRLSKTPKYLFFDLGVRRVSAREAKDFPRSYWGHLFEQWVGLEILRYLRSTQSNGKLYFWRDANGPEVDWVLELNNQYIPIEVKWTDRPTSRSIKHLVLFKEEYPNTGQAWVICQTPYKMKLAEGIYACPWQMLIPAIFGELYYNISKQ
jgi:predicted AAA+ superfamily ATPase